MKKEVSRLIASGVDAANGCDVRIESAGPPSRENLEEYQKFSAKPRIVT